MPSPQSSPAAAAVFDEADRVLGEPLSRLAFEGPAEDLDQTFNAQPALLATSIAMLAVLRERWQEAGVEVRPAFSAGHSMGQYSALVAAGAVSFADGLRLVRERGRLDAGLRRGATGRDGGDPRARRRPGRRGCLPARPRTGSSASPTAMRPGQVVISGERPAVEAALEAARELKARKVVLLPVSVAAHSPLMAEAAEGMRAVLATVPSGIPSHRCWPTPTRRR